MKYRYHPEPYWNEVARQIAGREHPSMIAGDDEPYYRYQREKFLRMFHGIDFEDRVVLELGPGPGGNLQEILKHHPKELYGADISDEMIAIARKNLSGKGARIEKTDGCHLPFADRSIDIVVTSTVLQHNTDETMLKKVIAEMCRVCRGEIYIFEKIGRKISGNSLCASRPVSYYEEGFLAGNFSLQETRFLNLPVSYLVSGSLRKLLNPSSRKEGEPVSRISYVLQQATLPLTRRLDAMFRSKTGLAMLHFRFQTPS